MLYKYAATDGSMVKQFGEKGGYNCYSTKCNNFGIVHAEHTCKGIRCDCCQTLWTEKYLFSLKVHIILWDREMSECSILEKE